MNDELKEKVLMGTTIIGMLMISMLSTSAHASAPMTTIQPVAIDTGRYVQTIVALLAVVSLILVLSYVLKQVQYKQFSGQKNMRLVGMLPITNKDRVILVQVAGKVLLLGSGQGGLTLLESFEEQSLDLGSQQEAVSFNHILANWIQRGQTK